MEGEILHKRGSNRVLRCLQKNEVETASIKIESEEASKFPPCDGFLNVEFAARPRESDLKVMVWFTASFPREYSNVILLKYRYSNAEEVAGCAGCACVPYVNKRSIVCRRIFNAFVHLLGYSSGP